MIYCTALLLQTSLIQVTSVLLVICYSNYHQRIGQRCLLGERVVYEKRISGHCCINGPDYERPINTTTCECSIEDFEWYGTALCGSFSLAASFSVCTYRCMCAWHGWNGVGLSACV